MVNFLTSQFGPENWGYESNDVCDCVVCDIYGHIWSLSPNARWIYQVACYKLTPKYSLFSIKFISTTYYPLNIHNTHILGLVGKKTTAGSSCVVKKPRLTLISLIRMIMYITLLQTCRFFCVWTKRIPMLYTYHKYHEKSYIRTNLFSTSGQKTQKTN